MVATGYGAVDRVAKAGDTMTGPLVLSASTPLQITTTGPGAGKVLVSDASGNASWGTAGGSGVTVPLSLSAAQASASILTVTNTTSAPSKPLGQYVANAAADQTLGIQVTGDTNQRLLIDSNGLATYGSGGAAGDVTWGRTAAGVVGTNGTLQAATVQGGTGASGTLTLTSTSNATKGKILVGTSAYDEVNNRLGIGNSTPAVTLDVTGQINASTIAQAPTLQGGSAASGTLTLTSTSNATKGKILFGTSGYDQVNNRLGVATATPGYPLDVSGAANISSTLTIGGHAIYAPSGTATTWQAPSYGSGWAAGPSGGTVLNLQFRLDAEDNLVLVGSMHSTSTTPAATVFTLPSGWRPATNHRAAIVSNNAGTITSRFVEIDSTGAVQISPNLTTSSTDVYIYVTVPMGNIS